MIKQESRSPQRYITGLNEESREVITKIHYSSVAVLWQMNYTSPSGWMLGRGVKNICHISSISPRIRQVNKDQYHYAYWCVFNSRIKILDLKRCTVVNNGLPELLCMSIHRPPIPGQGLTPQLPLQYELDEEIIMWGEKKGLRSET